MKTTYSDCCIYCGAFATDQDHFLPVSRYNKTIYYTVPSCSECNSNILGNKVFHSFRERCKFVHRELLIRYGNSANLWEDIEKADLGYTLKEMIKEQNNQAEYDSERIGWQATEKFLELYDEIEYYIINHTKDQDYTDYFK